MKQLVVGLGNPGKKYSNSKHNVGFMAIDSFAGIKNVKFKKSIKFNAEIAEYKDTILAKPTTFMNNSGYSILKIMQYYNIDIDSILVIYDDVALPLTKLRLRYKGSAGGHNGIKSIIAHLGSDNFKRIRVGIDKSQNKDMKDYVLSDFSKAELKLMGDIMITITSVIDDFIDQISFQDIMSRYNGLDGFIDETI
ncbi:MAG: aminoacyl-tRNA hydrolase [Candidatus Izemoplasmatales bacterium]|jgi:PTH1 family peptidyl-tRNA hydrolase|nr:aminoacyl-tRNA hydrolase [Candidatus Izemoplasmatales bacterium]MDD4069613.1 aminoacyl-tRNA hydrolase [Candidatus Izemoplasmatales bacterium]MDY0138436.1 aminoacyl-tRNA hydrolase [Candidatus Izemoplasmatales bacterium]